MPEAAIHEDRDALLGKDDVRPDSSSLGQGYRKVHAEPEPGCMQRRTEGPFGAGISAAVRLHDPPASLWDALPTAIRLSAAPAANLGALMTTLFDERQHTKQATGVSDEAVPDSDIDLDFLRRGRPIEDARGVPIVDLFSSLGGLTYGALEGLRRRGRPGHLRLAVDLDPAALRVLHETLGGKYRRFACADLSALLGPVADKPKRAERELLGPIKPGRALLLAGPPCQGHSALNNHTRHDDPRNDLYLSVARIARLIEPKAIVVENVRSVGSDRRGAVERCAAALGELGYEVTSKRLDLNQIGVPQTRVRHLLVATEDAAFDWDLPKIPGRDVRWAIEDLIDLEGATYLDSPSRPSPANQGRIDWLFENGRYDLPNPLRPLCHQSKHSYVSMYGRLRWDAPAQTVTSGFGSMGQGRYVHPRRRRTLTPHEAARLQCLPDYVRLATETRRSILATMIGNAAPPLLAARLVEALDEQGLL
jgi:DNA (cytosine-5)-methyltransferase 1